LHLTGDEGSRSPDPCGRGFACECVARGKPKQRTNPKD
jgi:hypothetical protein